MAKRAELIREIDVDDGTFIEPDVPPKTSADEALEDFVEKSRASGATAKITVKKLMNGVNSAESMCGSFPVDKYDYFELLEVIRDTWGAGDYRLYCTIKGRKGLIQNELVSIAAPLKSVSTNMALPQAGGNFDLMNSMLTAIQESNNKVIEALQKGGGTRQEMLQEMLIMKQLFDSGGQQKTSILSGVKEMAETMAILQELGGGGKETGLADIAVSAMQNLGPIAAALMTRSTPRQPHRRPPEAKPVPDDARVINAKPVPTSEPPKTETHPMQGYATQLNELCKMLAFVTPDPADIAEKIAESIDDTQAEALSRLLQGDDPVSELQTLCPAVEKHKEWFAELVEHLRGMAGLPSKYADDYADDGTEIDTEATEGDTSSHDENKPD